MKLEQTIKPDFLIVGAQKCGTSWLWSMLKQHPGTDLPSKKEPHFFSKTNNYRKGMDYYLSAFKHLDPSKVTGEASTSYLYDKVRLNVHLELRDIKPDNSLPTIPELITRELPDIKIIILLRDPVKRAVSAHYHHIKSNIYSPFVKFRDAIERYPNRITVGFGQYLKYVKLWKKFVSPERMRIFVFEEDVRECPTDTMQAVFQLLGLDMDFIPKNLTRPVHRRMGWSNQLINYYANLILKNPDDANISNKAGGFLKKKKMPGFIDKIAYKITPMISREDIDYLRSLYLPEKEELEKEIGRSLDCWTYDYKNKC